MAKKKELTIEKVVIQKESKLQDMALKNIVIKSHAEKEKHDDVNYIIHVDGRTEKTNTLIEQSIIVSIAGGKNVSWTQIKSLVNLINELRTQGAKSIKRYDEFYPGLVNPLFNLTHALTKFNIR